LTEAEHVHRLTWEQVFGGHAEVHIGPEAMLRLAEISGAPWNDSDPAAKLSPLQKEIITAPERTVVVFGGSRGGKSIAGACIALGHMLIPNCQIALIGANYEHCAKEFGYLCRGFFNIFPRGACTEATNITRSPHFSMRITTVWGSRVQVYSTMAKEGQQILGNEFDLAVLCEAAQMPADVYHVKIERALLGRAKQRTGTNYLRRTGRAILLTTPKGQGGASYDVHQRASQRTRGKLDQLLLKNGAGWFESLYFCQANVRELNPTYPVEAFEHAKRTLPKHAFEEQFLGRAIIRSGLVYSSFKEDETPIPKEKLPAIEDLRRCTFGVGIDTGNNFAAVLAAMAPDGKCYIIGEVKEVGQSTPQNAACVLDMVEKALEGVLMHPKEAISAWVVDVNSQNIIDLEDALGVAFLYQKYDLLDSIGHLDMKMGNGEIRISEECHQLLHEIRGYRYKSRSEAHFKTKDKPFGEDHLLDAMRYLLMQLFETGPPAPHQVVWTIDQMLERERNEMLSCNFERDMASLRRRQVANLLEAKW
jgi:hypothetical protein